MAETKGRSKPAIPFAADADLSRLSKQRLRPEEVRARMRDSLNIPNPPNAAAGIAPNSMLDGTRHEIPLSKIRCYDRNPRKSSNEAFDEIKASLAATGRESLELWVTQRPGQDWYMPYRGGNTRLTAIQELFQAGDSRWERLIVTYKVWVSEADTLAQHLIENNNRADMTFWDKACAYLVDMRAEIEREVGGTVSIRRLEDELAKRGVGVGKSQISRFQFAVERLQQIGPYLSGEQVKQLQPAINLQARLAEKFGLDDAGFQTVLDSVLEALRAQLEESEEKSDGVRADALLPALEAALAARLGATPSEIRRWLDTLGRFPDASVDDLRQAAAILPTQARKPAKKEAPSPASTEDSVTTLSSTESGNAEVQSNEHPAPLHASVVSEPAAASHAATTTLLMPSTPLEAVRALAEAAYVGDCLREHAAMPSGFYMEIPEAPIDIGVECPRSSHRIVAWQLLAALSGQWDATTCRTLPATSLWRRMRLCEGGLSADALPMLMQDQLLTDVTGISVSAGASDIGWGPSLGIGWFVALMTDPACVGPVSILFHQFTQRVQA